MIKDIIFPCFYKESMIEDMKEYFVALFNIVALEIIDKDKLENIFSKEIKKSDLNELHRLNQKYLEKLAKKYDYNNINQKIDICNFENFFEYKYLLKLDGNMSSVADKYSINSFDELLHSYMDNCLINSDEDNTKCIFYTEGKLLIYYQRILLFSLFFQKMSDVVDKLKKMDIGNSIIKDANLTIKYSDLLNINKLVIYTNSERLLKYNTERNRLKSGSPKIIFKSIEKLNRENIFTIEDILINYSNGIIKIDNLSKNNYYDLINNRLETIYHPSSYERTILKNKLDKICTETGNTLYISTIIRKCGLV